MNDLAAPRELSGRIPELDGLRGIAIGMVVVFHYFIVPQTARHGSALAYALVPGRLAWTGVDLFFVLSGFLIGGILMDARRSSNYFRVFYTRRFYRIVPIYSVLLVIACILVSLVHHGLSLGLNWVTRDELPLVPYIFYIQNFWMAFRNSPGSFLLAVTWSLAIEEQFYLTLPLLIRILAGARLTSVIVVGIFAAPILRISLHTIWPQNASSYFVLMPCRADALLLGVLGSCLLRDARWKEWLVGNRQALGLMLFVMVSGVAVLLVRASSADGFWMLSVGYTWMALFYLCFLLYAVTQRQSLISGVLRWGWLRGLGAIAYGVYLFHEPINGLFFGMFRGHKPIISSYSDFVVSICALFTTLLLCHFSWTYFENPLVRFGHRLGYKFANDRAQEVVSSVPKLMSI
jgi:peptidoglycan/LPS O-acetylase OafA/YrhL